VDHVADGAQFDNENAHGIPDIQYLISLKDPTDRMQKVLRNVVRSFAFSGEHVLDFAHTVTGFDQDSSNAGTVREFHIVAPVSNHKRTGHVNIKGSSGLLDEPCFRFSAITLTGVFRDDAQRVVRAEKDAVEAGLLYFE